MPQTDLHEYNPILEHPDRLRELTREYARFSHNAAGLGNVLGGVVVLLMWLTSNFVHLPLWSRLLFAAFPLAWIVFKEVLRSRYYLRHGLARQTWTVSQRRWHIGLTGFVALICAGIVTVVVYSLAHGGPLTWHWVGYLAFVVSMPLFVWRYMRTTEEFLVGVLLFCQAAVLIAGGHYPISWWTLYFPLFALVAIVVGLLQHRDYRSIDRRLRALAQRA